MTTPWRGAAPPGRQHELVQMGRFGGFRTKYVSQGVLTATGPPGYHFKHLFTHFLFDHRPTGQNARRKNGEKARPQLESVIFEAENCAGGDPKPFFRTKI